VPWGRGHATSGHVAFQRGQQQRAPTGASTGGGHPGCATHPDEGKSPVPRQYGSTLRNGHHRPWAIIMRWRGNGMPSGRSMRRSFTPRGKQQGPRPRVLGKCRDRSHGDRLRRRCWDQGRTGRHNARGGRQNLAHQGWWHGPLYLGRRTAATRAASQLGVAAILPPHKAMLFQMVGQRGASSKHLV